MNYLVTYWSMTGNTKKIAEAIFGALSGQKEIRPFEEVHTLEGADIIFIGFPVMQFGPPAAVMKFLSDHAVGRRIALFITHAMHPDSEDPLQRAMLERELGKCRAACREASVAGLFHCQGELSEKTANDLLSSGIPMLEQFAAMRTQTLGHPNEKDIERAKIFAREIIGGSAP